MKTLEDHLILYDADCPMCRAYTKAFVRTKMLDATGREAYQQMPDDVCPVVDRQRAVNEIALVNKQTGEVSYGINSLFKLIGHSCPVFKPLFSFRPFEWLMSKLYAFISYNRRVIIPATRIDTLQIQPTFRLDYRLAYLIVTWLVISVILTGYANLLSPVLPTGAPYREFVICGGQVLFQGLMVNMLSHRKCWEYLGNMMTISFGGALMLLPALLLAKYFQLSTVFTVGYFMFVAGLMLLEHIRRLKILKVSKWLTIIWVTYMLFQCLMVINNC